MNKFLMILGVLLVTLHGGLCAADPPPVLTKSEQLKLALPALMEMEAEVRAIEARLSEKAMAVREQIVRKSAQLKHLDAEYREAEHELRILDQEFKQKSDAFRVSDAGNSADAAKHQEVLGRLKARVDTARQVLLGIKKLRDDLAAALKDLHVKYQLSVLEESTETEAKPNKPNRLDELNEFLKEKEKPKNPAPKKKEVQP